MTQPRKYPRTRHLPWSPGATADDIHLNSTEQFEGRRVVVTEKMDGENTTLYQNRLHARSIDGRHHPSRNWVKGLHGRMGHLIPEGFRVCGENLFARHSIAYDNLPSYFLVFSVWNENNECLSWDETTEWIELLELHSVPVLYDGLWNEDLVRSWPLDLDKQEGLVVRLADRFAFEEFDKSVAKWVRTGHVQTDTHWMHAEVMPNGLCSGK